MDVSSIIINLKEFIPLAVAFSRFIIAIVIIVAGFIIGKSAGKFVEDTLSGLEFNGFNKRKRKKRINLIAGMIVKYFIYIVALILSLNQIGIALNFLNNILIILLVMVAVGLFLSIKDFIPNAVAGAYIIYKGRIKVGQTIKVKNVKGKIDKIDLIETKVKTNGHYVLIPNSFFIRNTVEIKEK